MLLMPLNFWLRVLAVPAAIGAIVAIPCYVLAPFAPVAWALGGGAVAFALTLYGVIRLIDSE